MDPPSDFFNISGYHLQQVFDEFAQMCENLKTADGALTLPLLETNNHRKAQRNSSALLFIPVERARSYRYLIY
jgi:hypothetical protein